MILVDISVPLMGRTYDFKVNEEAEIVVLIAELSEIICQHERWPRPSGENGMFLCDAQSGQIFPEDGTLASLGVTSGHQLMLI